MHKDPAFIPIVKKEDFNKGILRNIVYKESLKLVQTEKYALNKTIDIFEKNIIKHITNYACEDYGIIYLVDEKSTLWELDTISNKLEKIYVIDELKYLVDFIVDNNKIYALFKDTYYYTKIFCLNTGQIIRELSTCIEEIQDYCIGYNGNIFLLDNKLRVTRLCAKQSISERFCLKNIIQISDEKLNTHIITTDGEKILGIANKLTGDISLLDLDKIKSNDKGSCQIEKLKGNNIKHISMDRLTNLYINHEKNGQICIEKTIKFKRLEQLSHLKMIAKKIVFDKKNRIFLRSEDDLIYVIKKKMAVNSMENLRKNTGVYYSPILDSRQEDMRWHKVLIDAHIPKDTQLKISYYAFNNKPIYTDNRVYTIMEFIEDKYVSTSLKEQYLNGYWQGSIINPKEALFQEAKGRYIILKIEFNGRQLQTPVINKIRVYYNRSSYLKYLPEIFQGQIQEDDFLERYLSIFESFYMDIEEKIDCVSKYFNVDKTPPKFLRWLCKWIGMETYQTWDDKKLRQLIKKAPYLYRKRGTKAAIESILQIYLGKKPTIVESFLINDMVENIELKHIIKKLYGDNPYSYTVLINSKRDLNQDEIEWIDKILKNESPAFCEYKFIILKPWIFLNKHSYIGLNSCISGYTCLKLDGKSMLPYNAILIDNGRENQLNGYTRLNINGNLD